MSWSERDGGSAVIELGRKQFQHRVSGLPSSSRGRYQRHLWIARGLGTICRIGRRLRWIGVDGAGEIRLPFDVRVNDERIGGDGGRGTDRRPESIDAAD